MADYFSHEKLDLYRESIAFISWWTEFRPRRSGVANVLDQLDRASTSVPLNIAEGNGKYSLRDRSRYFQIASGSALECAACLDVLVARKRLTSEEVEPGKRRLKRIVSRLMGLINKSSSRVAEEEADYEAHASSSDEIPYNGTS